MHTATEVSATTWSRIRQIGARPTSWVIECGMAVLVLAGVFVPLQEASDLVQPLSPVHLVITLAVIAAAATATLLAEVAARLSRSSRLRLIAAALAVYGGLVVPFVEIGAGGGRAAAVSDAVAVAGLALAAGLVLAALLTPPRRAAGRAVVRAGLGALAIGLAHAHPVLAHLGVTDTDRHFPVLQLLGLLLLLSAMARSARAVKRAGDRQRARLEAELVAAAAERLRAEQEAEERDHELRNGLSGLSGIAQLFDGPSRSPGQERLGSAVTSELRRLLALVAGGVSTQDAFPVRPVLDNLAELRRSAGLPTHVQAPPDLWVDGDRALVVQVLTNLLANCSRHAPGSTVWLTARRCGERAVLEVRDNGPGVPDGAEEAVFGRGVRDPSTGGEGLGLFLCRRLLAANGGTARLGRGDGPPESPGCIVTVELGAAPRPALPLPQPMAPVAYPLHSTRLSA